MWPSSNMFLKKLINNLCIFPRSASSSSASNKNKPPSHAPSSFSTHLARHFSTQPFHRTEDEEDTRLDSTQNENKQAEKKEKKMMMMIKSNLNTLDPSTSKSTTPDDDDDDYEDEDVFFTSSSNHSDHHHHHLISDHHHNQQQPDFATAYASQRFFFSSPGHSKSLIHHQSSSTPPQLESMKTNNSGPLLMSAGGVPVPKYSPDPYWDFRKSMQEMVEARSKEEEDAAENWEYLHQLLTCYLTLNPINTHECIIKAFSDLLVNFVLNKRTDDKDDIASSCCGRRSDGRRPPSVSRRLL